MGELHKRSAEAWGDPLRGANGAEPLRKAWLPYTRTACAPIYKGRRCGQEQARSGDSEDGRSLAGAEGGSLAECV